MKALSLTQPWATLVAIGAKRIETRSWATQYRGPLAIHAAAGLGPVGGKRGLLNICRSAHFIDALPKVGYQSVDRLPRGVIVAHGYLVGCEETADLVEDQGRYKIVGGKRMHWPLTDQERVFGDYSPGRFAWLLADIKPLLEPIPAKGALSLWEWQPPEGFGV